MTSARIHLRGPDHTTPDARSSWQRERASAPITDEFRGRYRLATWAVCGVVGVLFWAAVVMAAVS